MSDIPVVIRNVILLTYLQTLLNDKSLTAYLRLTLSLALMASRIRPSFFMAPPICALKRFLFQLFPHVMFSFPCALSEFVLRYVYLSLLFFSSCLSTPHLTTSITFIFFPISVNSQDIHYWTDGRIGDFVVNKPMILGHEGSGVVRLVGEDVHGLDEGDRVAIEPGVPCSQCPKCKGGAYNLCPGVKFAATPPVDGSLAHFVVHPASFCYKLPPMVSFDEAALFEPLSVAIHACRRANLSLGHTVLITGAGTIGLACMLVAKASGAANVIILDIEGDRLQVAKEMGADRVILTHSESDPKVTVESIEADVCIDATGVESAIKTCIFGAKRGGVVVLIGMGKPEIILPVLEIGIREIDIRGVFRYCNTYPTALELVASGKIQMKRLVTHRFKLADAEDAFQVARDRANKAIKVVIDCGPQGIPPPKRENCEQ